MMRPAGVAGIGLVGGFGCGVDDALAALRTGGGPNDHLETPAADGTRKVPVYRADEGELKRFWPKGKLRRINRFSRLALLGASLALADAGLDVPVVGDRLGVVVATGYGASTTTFRLLDSIIEDGDTLASPMRFSSSVHSCAASNVTILLGLHGPALTVTQFELSAAMGLAAALQWLDEGRVDAVLFGAVEELNTVRTYCRERFFGRANDGPIDPLALSRASAVAGEGAAFLVLQPDAGGARHGRVEAAWMHPPGERPDLPGGQAVLLGADGHRRCGRWYERLDTAGAEVRSFAPVTGAMPSAQAFDVALGLLAMNRGILAASRATAVKADMEGNFGCIRIAGA